MEKLNYETIKHYQSFTSIDEMDLAVRGFLYKFKSTLSDGANKVLHFLWRYSVKVVGVSFAKYDTIANEISLSRRTVIRAVKLLEELSFLKKIPTARMNGKQGVNLLVIQPFESIDSLLQPVSPQDVTLPVTANKAENKQSSLCESNNQNRINVKESEINHQSNESTNSQPILTEEIPVTHLETHSNTNQNNHALLQQTAWHELDASFLPDYVHEDFIKAAQPFFPIDDIYKIWSKINLAYKKLNLSIPFDDVIEPMIMEFKQTIFKYKRGIIHTTFEGYFYKVVYNRLCYIKTDKHLQMVYNRILNI
ncbi:helix-turn-helix domain-containing protein [Niallia sp. XMNu-256]|uniref:helix-turn-helix domain-containing protein n=1 Tax=Niallia sp. XMNu-256 TaxID=3082444 RepID=UPI0030CE17B9